MFTLKLTKELFVETFNQIQKQLEHDQKCGEAFQVILPDDFVSGYNNNFLLSQLIKILKIGCFDNTSDSMIEYFIWDLDFGKEYKDGCITDKNGYNIDISTVEKLYDYLYFEYDNTLPF